ncbi:hypothetical protein V1264_003556 [Littorina saxatilis]|uniref:Uncharacterized protein n=1 Tax=Littorina saxatilis TaxID=31220 RepID=A0AAN9B7N9_9CAEN
MPWEPLHAGDVAPGWAVMRGSYRAGDEVDGLLESPWSHDCLLPSVYRDNTLLLQHVISVFHTGHFCPHDVIAFLTFMLLDQRETFLCV